ncbi:MAG: trypsin-like peptidase domain-containing protein [Bdellovibrio sp.]|nr:trypsin-like peptidase domain-containing protein [Bdellovibrio sp.]
MLPPTFADNLVPRPPDNFFERPGDGIVAGKFNKILSREAHGVAKIQLTHANGQESFGTGTFLSAEGHLISNLHVLKPLRDNPKVKVTYLLRNGTVLHSSTFIKCDDQPGIDLCIVRLNTKPHYWFPLKIKLPTPYTALYMIGNPLNKDFEILAGRLLLPSTPESKGARRLEVSVPVRPGFSGGPIFDDDGKLVCIASELRYSHTLIGINWEPDPSSLQYYCIEASVVSKYIRKQTAAP